MNGNGRLTDWIDDKIGHWRQGDVSLENQLEFVHVADLSHPHSPASIESVRVDTYDRQGIEVVSDYDVLGFVVLTQTCDIVRSSYERPFIEVAPLVKIDDKSFVDQVRRLQRPAFAYVPSVANIGLVADLDRVMTIEKGVLANWKGRKQGCKTDQESREFARAIARKRLRFAFPDDFVQCANRFRQHVLAKHNRLSEVGSHLRTLSEIRVGAAPSWTHDTVNLTFWFIKERDPTNFDPNWSTQIAQWIEYFDAGGRFKVENAIACSLADITARDYIDSDVLDFDSVSVR